MIFNSPAKANRVCAQRRGMLLVSIIGLIVAILLITVCAFVFSAAPASLPIEGQWVPVTRGDFEIVCREEGELRPVKVTALTFPYSGKIGFLIPEGTFVKKGEKVAGLEVIELEEEIQHLQEDLTTLESTLSQQEQTRDLELKRLNTEISSEKERVLVAKLKEQDVLSHPTSTEKEEAQNLLDVSEARLVSACTELEAFKPLADKGYSQKSDLRDKELAVAKTTVERQRAEMKAGLISNGARPEERIKANLQLQQAELGLKLKGLEYEAQTDSLSAKVRSAKRSVEQAQLKLERRKLELQRSTMLAPHDGIVVYRIIDWMGNKKMEVGERVGPWISPMELPNYEKMKVRTQVPESFVRRLKVRSTPAESQASSLPDPSDPSDSGGGKTAEAPVRAGSRARVKVKTLPDRVYNAEVIWVDGWARDRNSKLSEADVKAQGLAGVRVFDVEVELEESDKQRLRDGFRAAVEFPIEVLKDVINIPAAAVSNRNETPHVQVLQNGAPQWRKIQLGARSVERVVVAAGLKEGEMILLPHQSTQQQQPQQPSQSSQAAAPSQQPAPLQKSQQPQIPREGGKSDGKRGTKRK